MARTDDVMLRAACGCRPSSRFTVVIGDAVKRRDPTQTADIRNRFKTDVSLRMRALKKIVRAALIEQDILGFGKTSVATIAALAGSPGASHVPGVQAATSKSKKLDAFQNWFWHAIREIVIGREGLKSWTAQYISAAYDRGWLRAQTLSGRMLAPDHDRLDTLLGLAFAEVEGIADAIYQQSNRAMTDIALKDGKPSEIFKAIADRIEKVGITRGRALAATMTVRAFSEATLDGFMAAGIEKVGIVPELVPSVSVKDALTVLFDAKKVKAKRRRKIKQSAPDEVFPEEVDVLTAGDDKVCQQCEDIAASGPYEIFDARGLIPAHPNCRCAFIPHFDLRFKGDAGFDESKHPRAPSGSEHGGEFTILSYSAASDVVRKLEQKSPAITKFTEDDNFYRTFNGDLRRGDDLKHKEMMDKLREDMKPIGKDLVAYRGIKERLSMRIGDEVDQKGFMSTSLSRDQATGFAGIGSDEATHGYTMVEVRATKGTKAIFTNPKEAEVIFNHGQRFKVTEARHQFSFNKTEKNGKKTPVSVSEYYVVRPI